MLQLRMGDDVVPVQKKSLRERNREAAREAVLDAAERLLRSGAEAQFSMRQLAAEAGVGVVTPFNHFGTKSAIMQALSVRLIARMAARFQVAKPSGDCIDRVLAMGRISTGLLLEEPEVSKAVVGSLGTVDASPSAASQHSRALWTLALGDFSGLTIDQAARVRFLLPEQLAVSFRGCVSFWIAGELNDAALGNTFETGACALLLSFVQAKRRRLVLERMEACATVPKKWSAMR